MTSTMIFLLLRLYIQIKRLQKMSTWTGWFCFSSIDKTLKYEKHDGLVTFTFRYSDKKESTKWSFAQGNFDYSCINKTFKLWQARWFGTFTFGHSDEKEATKWILAEGDIVFLVQTRRWNIFYFVFVLTRPVKYDKQDEFVTFPFGNSEFLYTTWSLAQGILIFVHWLDFITWQTRLFG